MLLNCAILLDTKSQIKPLCKRFIVGSRVCGGRGEGLSDKYMGPPVGSLRVCLCKTPEHLEGL